MSRKARVLLVEDQPIVRHGLVQLLEEQQDLTVCGEVENLEEALQEVQRCKPDVVLLDISLKGVGGIKLVKDIKTRWADLPVLVLSMYGESLYAERALRAGATGYVLREEATETLLAALRRVLGGDVWVSEEVAGRMLRKFLNSGNSRVLDSMRTLTDRELEVLEFIGRGFGTRQIAEMMGLSVRTVESHRAHIKQKLSLQNATELIHYAVHWVQSQEVG